MFITDSQINRITEMVYRLYLPSDICRYLNLDFDDFKKELKTKESQLYKKFYETLFECEEDIKEEMFSSESKYTTEKLDYLKRQLDNYKIKLELELDE